MTAAILRVAQQTPASVAGLWTSSILLALAWGCQLLGYSQPADWMWMLSTAGAVLVGAAALGRLRPQRVGFTASQAMLVLGAVGMMLGLAIDSRTTQLAALASLCAQTDKSLWPMLKLHWTLLPWMHVGMWVGGLAAIPLLRSVRPAGRRQYCARVAQNIACSACMTVGMAAGVLQFEYFIALIGQRGAASMLGGMFGGMTWGMVASVAAYRVYFACVPSRVPSQSPPGNPESAKDAHDAPLAAACASRPGVADFMGVYALHGLPRGARTCRLPPTRDERRSAAVAACSERIDSFVPVHNLDSLARSTGIVEKEGR